MAVAAGFRWALFTNGILLTRPLAARLLELRPAFLRVSLDAGSPEEHARVYGVTEDVFSFTSAIHSTAEI